MSKSHFNEENINLLYILHLKVLFIKFLKRFFPYSFFNILMFCMFGIELKIYQINREGLELC